MPNASASPGKIVKLLKRLRTAATPQVFFGDVIYGPGGTCGPRVQLDYHIVILIEGDLTITVGGQVLTLTPGEMALLRPGKQEFFQFSTKLKTHQSWCSLRPEFVPPDVVAAIEASPAKVRLTRRFDQVMELGLSLPRGATDRVAGLIESLGLAALQEYLYAASLGGQKTAEPDALRRALEWIGHAGHERTDLPKLAREAGVSPAQLVKLFKQHFDTTPLRFVWTARTRRGVQMLRETGLTVAEVANRCGFKSPFHFSRWVRALHGAPPRVVRAQAWAAQL
jgi:AraC-like DNA-binding protein